MRKINLRSILWGTLSVASFSAYVYLSGVRCEMHSAEPRQAINQEEVDESQQDSKVFLPDVALVKTILNLTKIVLPED
jgi:hypothetical protein